MKKRKEIRPYFSEIQKSIQIAEELLNEGNLEGSLEKLKDTTSYLGTTNTYIKNEIKYKERGYRHRSELNKFNEDDIVEFLHTQKTYGSAKCTYHKGDVGRVVGYEGKNRVRVLFPGRKYAVSAPEDVLKIYHRSK